MPPLNSTNSIACLATIMIHLMIILLPVSPGTPVVKPKPIVPLRVSITQPPKPKPVPKKTIKPTPKPLPKKKKVIQKKKKQRISPTKKVATVSKKTISKSLPKPQTPVPKKTGVVIPFSVLTSIAPVYPKQALNYNLEGKVIVEFNTGAIMSHTIVESSGHDILDQTFIQTVRSAYKIKPKRIDGQPVSGNLILDHEFKL